METDINIIRKLSKDKEKENWEFRSYLKGGDIPAKKIDSIVYELYQKVSSEIDCRTCANCCKEVQPVLDQKDIERFSKCLGISVAKFKDQYLVKDEEPGKFVFNKKPCPFLKDNLCSHYNCRPKDCKSYPHLDKSGFIFRLINMVGICSICPIVFNVYESLKDEIRNYDDPDSFDDLL
jgi:Fe-S-cluster containining protein